MKPVASLASATVKRKQTTLAFAPNKRTKLSVEESVVEESSTNAAPSSEAIEDLERETMEPEWYKALESEFKKPYFRKVEEFLAQEERTGKTVFPAKKDIYSWSRLTPLSKVKAVVLGQDPYHDANQAHGLAFSVLPPTKPPPSLKNIYKQIASDIPSFTIPATGDLSPLAREGVLWLNTCLTVRAHQANSHSKKGWETFTQAVLSLVNAQTDGVVFFAWGSPALKVCEKLKIDTFRHLLLSSVHPSPLSASRGFFGNGHFKKANEWLQEKYGPEGRIDWAALCH